MFKGSSWGCARGLSGLMLLATLIGCSPRIVVRPDVIVPAQIPVRSFPAIWVAGGHGVEEQSLLDRVAQHLANDRATEVRRVDVAELEPAREANAIPVATVVLSLDLKFEETTRTYVGQQPVQYCGIASCWVTYANYVGTTQVVLGTAKATVYDGPTARVLQERPFTADVAGNDIPSMRASVLTSLSVQITQAVDMLRTQLRIPLARADMRGLDQALKLMKHGSYAQALPLLEALSKQLGGQTKRTQAAIWYDLGIARWFARGDAGLDAQSYAGAKRAFVWAERVQARRGAERALRELELDWQRAQIRAQQEQARAYNFSLMPRATPAAGAPAPGEAPGAPLPLPPAASAPNAAPTPSAAAASPAAPVPPPPAPAPVPPAAK